MDNILGIVGGMGPMASNVFYKMIIEKTKVSCDQEHMDIILFNHATMPDRTKAILSNDEAEKADVTQKLLTDCETLEKLGCKAIVVTCNTAHYFVDKIEKDMNIPFIHLIRETAKEAAKTCKGEKVGIMATDGTIKTKLYQDRLEQEGAIPCVPPEDIQKLVMHEIYDCVKPGKPVDEVAWTKIENAFKAMGCKKVILACTELSVVKSDNHLSDYYIDPYDVVATIAVKMMGKTLVE